MQNAHSIKWMKTKTATSIQDIEMMCSAYNNRDKKWNYVTSYNNDYCDCIKILKLYLILIIIVWTS